MILILLYISYYDLINYQIEDKALYLIIIYHIFSPNVFSFLIISVFMKLFYWLVNRIYSRSFGYGDVKLISVLSLGLHIKSAFLMIMLSFFIASIYIIVTKKIKGQIAFAPFISISYIIVCSLIKHNISYFFIGHSLM